jgi:CubicO group peptidase (beta-lactamase class C family)
MGTLRHFACVAAVLGLPMELPAQIVLTKPESVGMSSEKLHLIHDALKLNIEAGQIPGGVVTVLKDGKVVYLEAQGVSDTTSNAPLTTDTIFGIASLSKPITAVAIMILVEQGKINLDDPVSKFIPEFGGQRQVRVLKAGSPPPPYTPLPGMLPPTSEFGPPQYELVPAERTMTVKMLLTHTSGVQIFGVSNDFPTAADGADMATRLPKIGRLPLEFQPGSRWAYANGVGFDLLGLIVQVASGQPFNVFVKQHILLPLDMKDTDYGVKRVSVGRSLPLMPGMKPAIAEETTYFSGSAGISSTVTDYSHFAQMLVDGGIYAGHRILSAETVHEMSSNQIGPLYMAGYPPMAMPSEGLKFGLGMLTVTIPSVAGTHVPVGSFGWDGVGTRRFWAIPTEHIVIVSMVPLIGPAAAPLQREIEAAVMASVGK